MARARQNYRIFIHGHSFRHVFGTDKAKDVTGWLAKLVRGEQPGFPRRGVYDWSVEKRTDDGWAPISPQSKRELVDELNKRLQETE